MSVNQQSSPVPASRHRFDGIWWARRGAVIAFVLVVIVFGTESTLAVLRRRDVTLHLNVYNPSVPATPVSTAAPSSGPLPTATPAPAVLSLSPSDRLVLDVQWYYHIGPRFPQTTIHATVLIGDRDVGEGKVLIDCGAAVLDCSGDQPITLAYTIPDTGNGSAVHTVDWPDGDYTVTVDRSDGGLTPHILTTYAFRVTG